MRPNIPPLTSVRFVAALMVVIFHYDKKILLFPLGLTDFGYESVTFFFLLSGFILTYTHGRHNGLNVTFRQFADSRMVRIAPAYFLALIVAGPFLIAAAIKVGRLDAGIFLVPLMLQSWLPSAALLWNSPAWSLSNEVFFYSLYPLIWSVWQRMRDGPTLVAAYGLVVAATVLRAMCADSTTAGHNFAYYFPLLNLPQFILGVAIAKTFLEFGSSPRSGAIFWFSAAALSAVITFKADCHWIGSNAVLCVIFGPMIYSLAGIRGRLRSILSANWLLRLGDASYAIYILHVPIWLWWDRIIRVKLNLQLYPLVDFIIYLSAVIAISLSVAAFIEKPIRRLRDKMNPVTYPG